ncbi:MAG: adenylate kinase [Oscillospiraceae bacterium]|jgi:adenylate kinase|nr:adenylate kinase [Oscillospiraceae bacterium]
MKIVLLGAPGVGKGTQAAVLSKRLNILVISTGNILREALKSGSDMGKKAKSFIDQGQLVPDEVVTGIVKEKISQDDCKNGYILDGFPRTISQAEALRDMHIKIDKVIDINVSDSVIYERMTGRRVCMSCGSTYNINTAGRRPKVDNTCDKCADTLVKRTDDSKETVKHRLEVYRNQTEPLVNYYKETGKLVIINGERPPEEITEKILEEIRN